MLLIGNTWRNALWLLHGLAILAQQAI